MRVDGAVWEGHAEWGARRDGERGREAPDLVFYDGGLCIGLMRKWPCGLQKLEGVTFLRPPKWNGYIPKKK